MPLPTDIESPRALCLSADKRRLYLVAKTGNDILVVEDGAAPVKLCTLPHPIDALCMSAAGLVCLHVAGLIGVNLRHGTFTTIWTAPDALRPLRDVVALPDKCYLVTGKDGLWRVSRDGSTHTELVPTAP